MMILQKPAFFTFVGILLSVVTVSMTILGTTVGTGAATLPAGPESFQIVDLPPGEGDSEVVLDPGPIEVPAISGINIRTSTPGETLGPAAPETANETLTQNSSGAVYGSLSGHVYQADGTTPIAGAVVSAYLEDWSNSYSTISKIDGSYTIDGLQLRQYWIFVNASGYIREYYNGAYNSDTATLVNVTNSQNTNDVDFTLDVGCSTSGHVYQADGATPIAGAVVSASPGYKNCTSTQIDGSYTVSGLPPGQYLISVNAASYIREYYAGAYGSNEATPVSVSITQNATDIDFTLDAGGSISGHVYQADGTTPIAGAWVSADFPDGSFGNSTPSGSDGSYTVSGLRPGHYRLFANATGYIKEYYTGVHVNSAAALVSVTGSQNTPDVDFTLDVGGSISGHVYQVDGITPLVGAYVVVSRADWSYSDSTFTSSSGAYTIAGLLTGQYRVQAHITDYIGEYYNGVYSDNAATLINVTVPDDTQGIDLTLDLGGSISGHVYQTDGMTPIPRAYVSVGIQNGSFSNYTTTSTDGSYSVRELISGQYNVFASANGYLTEYYDGIHNSEPANTVSVTISQITPDINITLDIGGSISGHVYQADGNTPLAGVKVDASGPDGWSSSTETAMDGSYIVRDLISGQYRVSAAVDGYLTEYYNSVFDSSSATPLDVTISQNISDIDFNLDVGGSISGHVYQADGTTPVAGAYVFAVLSDSSWNDSSTAPDGSYTIDDLRPGQYKVIVNAAGYIRECYDGVYNDDSATLINVALSQNTSEINFTLDVDSSISGHIYQADGTTPIEGANVLCVFWDWGYRKSICSNPDGNYTIVGLLPGQYRVYVFAQGYLPEYYDDVYDLNSAILVNVTFHNNTSHIDFTLDVGGSISGHVYQADGATPIAGAAVLISPVSGDYSNSTSTSSNGSYSVIDLQPGQYHVSASATGYKTKYYDNVYNSESATPVDITVSNNTTNIDFDLDQASSGGFFIGGSGVANSVPLTPKGFTQTSVLALNSSGVIQGATQLTTVDSKVTLKIADQTKLLDEAGNPLSQIMVDKLNSLPNLPSGNAILMAYEFGPDGAKFDPALTLTMSYDPANLPVNVAEKDLYIRGRNGTNWEAVKSDLDLKGHTVSAAVSHFSSYALMGKIVEPTVSSPTPRPTYSPTPKPEPEPSPALSSTPVNLAEPAPSLTPIVNATPAPPPTSASVQETSSSTVVSMPHTVLPPSKFPTLAVVFGVIGALVVLGVFILVMKMKKPKK